MSNFNILNPVEAEGWVCAAFCNPDTKPDVVNWLTSTFVKWMLTHRQFVRPVMTYDKREMWLATIVMYVEATFGQHGVAFPEWRDANGRTRAEAAAHKAREAEENAALYDMRPTGIDRMTGFPVGRFFEREAVHYGDGAAQVFDVTAPVDLVTPMPQMEAWMREELDEFMAGTRESFTQEDARCSEVFETLTEMRDRAPLFVKLDELPAWAQKRIGEGVQLWAVADPGTLQLNLNMSWFSHAIDFLHTLPPGQIRYTVPQLQVAVLAWDEELARVKVIEEMSKGCELAHTLTDPKWTVWLLRDKIAFENEGASLGHCVAGYHGKDASLLYSIRLDGRSKATIEINRRYRSAVQVRGTKNHFPAETTREKIEEWLAHARYSLAEDAYTKSFGVEVDVEANIDENGVEFNVTLGDNDLENERRFLERVLDDDPVEEAEDDEDDDDNHEPLRPRIDDYDFEDRQIMERTRRARGRPKTPRPCDLEDDEGNEADDY